VKLILSHLVQQISGVGVDFVDLAQVVGQIGGQPLIAVELGHYRTHHRMFNHIPDT